MNAPRFNWQVWAGFLLSFGAALSYPYLFVRWPLTRDFPWATLILFGIAAVLLLLGLRRAFAPGRSARAKIAASIVATLSVVIIALFVFSILIMARWLPAASGAPRVGQKAPDFSLSDANGRQVSLSQLLSSPINSQPDSGSKPKGVLLIFYRGYW